MLPTAKTPILGTHWGTYKGRFSDGILTALTPIAEDPDPSPIAQGMIDAHDAPSRIRRPAVRKGFLDRLSGKQEGTAEARGRDAFVELPWDEALDIAAGEIDRIRRDHGNQAIFGGSYGWGSAGRFHHAQSQIHRFLNSVGGYTRSVQNYSYAAGDVIVPHVIGDTRGLSSDHTSWQQIAENTETLVLFGGLPRKNAQINSGGVSRHILTQNLDQLAARGTRIVSISPVRDDTVGEGVEWWPIRPGTDVALMLAIAHTIIAQGRQDQAFLDRCTTGFDPFKSYVLGEADGAAKTAEWAAGITDIPADKIRELAASMTGSRCFVIRRSWAPVF